MKYKLINRETYKGLGRPRKKDYLYCKNKKEYFCLLIGEPRIPLFPVPVIVSLKKLKNDLQYKIK